MNEVIMILFSVLNFFIIFNSPLVFLKKNISEINLFDIMIINSIIFINLLLLFSFFPVNSNFIFLIISLISYFFFFFEI